MSDPRVQAGYMKDVVAALARLGAEGERMRAADPELMRAVDEAPRGAWLPIELNLRWVEAAERAFGWEGALAFLTARVREELAAPALRGLVEGGVRLLGLRPGSLVRLVPRGLAITFRDCGAWSAVRTSECSIELRASRLPEPVASHTRWIESIGAAPLAMFAVCGVPGSMRLADHRPAQGSAVVEARWSAPR